MRKEGRLVPVQRDGRTIKVWFPPEHPRFSMSFSQAVKDAIGSEELRFKLADALAPYVSRALERFPDDPIEVDIGEDTYLLSEHPNPSKRGKVHVRIQAAE